MDHEILRRQRIFAGLTQKEAAELVGTNWHTWQRWEYGKAPMPKTAEKLWSLLLPEIKAQKRPPRPPYRGH